MKSNRTTTTTRYKGVNSRSKSSSSVGIHDTGIYKKKYNYNTNKNRGFRNHDVNQDDTSYGNRNTSSNPNIQRCMSAVIECNGIKANNNLQTSVISKGVAEVTSYNSVMLKINKNGNKTDTFQSSLVLSLISKIEQYGTNKTVVGCVAWLSHPDILNALKQCKRVLIIVNREDYTTWGGGTCVRHYKELEDFEEPLSIAFQHLDTVLNTLESNRKSGQSSFAPIRAYGGTTSLEHNKWLVFFENRFVTFKMLCDDTHNLHKFVDPAGLCKALKRKLRKEHLSLEDGAWFEFPCAYWTGSMNFTKKSEQHHESAEFIVNDDLAFNKFTDFSATFMNSTPVFSSNKTSTPMRKAGRTTL